MSDDRHSFICGECLTEFWGLSCPMCGVDASFSTHSKIQSLQKENQELKEAVRDLSKCVVCFNAGHCKGTRYVCKTCKTLEKHAHLLVRD